MSVSIRENLNKVENLFQIFNQHYFDGELITPIITFNPNTNARKSSLGWCSTKKIWNNGNTRKGYYEITICPEFLDRNIYEISATLLHEMTHLYNIQKNIKDCSRNNTYHNKKFKQEAEKRGLIILFDKRIGWSVTKLNEEAKHFIGENIDFKLVPLTRGKRPNSITGNDEDDESKERKKSSRKYICPICNISIRATKEVRIKCIDCDEEMIEEV